MKPASRRWLAGLLVAALVGTASPAPAFALRASGLEENAALANVANQLGVPSDVMRTHHAGGLEEQGTFRRAVIVLGVAALLGVPTWYLWKNRSPGTPVPAPGTAAPALQPGIRSPSSTAPTVQLPQIPAGTRIGGLVKGVESGYWLIEFTVPRDLAERQRSFPGSPELYPNPPCAVHFAKEPDGRWYAHDDQPLRRPIGSYLFFKPERTEQAIVVFVNQEAFQRFQWQTVGIARNLADIPREVRVGDPATFSKVGDRVEFIASAPPRGGLEERGITRRLATLALGAAAFLGVHAAQPSLAQPAPVAAGAPAQPVLRIEKSPIGVPKSTHYLDIQGSPGAPGRTYRIETAEAVTGPWTEEGFVRTDASGVGRMEIVERPGPGQRFFRAALAGPDTPEVVRHSDDVFTTTFDTQGYGRTMVLMHPPSTVYDADSGLFTTTESEETYVPKGTGWQSVSETTTITTRDAAGGVMGKTVTLTHSEYFEDDRMVHIVRTTDTYEELDGQRIVRDHVVEDQFYTLRPDAYGSTEEKTVVTTYSIDTLQPRTRETTTVTSLADLSVQRRITEEFLAHDPTTGRLETSLTLQRAGSYLVDRPDRSATRLVEAYWTSTTHGPDDQPIDYVELNPQIVETTEADGTVTRSTITTPTFGRSAAGDFVPTAWTIQSEVTVGGAVTQNGDVTGAYDPNAQVTTITLPNGLVITRSDREGTLQVGGPGRAPLLWKHGQAGQSTRWPDGLSATITSSGTIRVMDPASPFITIISLDGVIRYRPAGGLEELRDRRPGTSTQA